MRVEVGVYLAVARSGFRRHASYRLATAAGGFTNTVFGFIRAFVLIAVWQARPHIGGYDVADAVLFCFLTQALIAPVAIFGEGLELPERIRTGDVVIDLYRPVDFQGWWLAADLGRAGFAVVFRGLPPLAAGVLAFGLALPGSPLTWLAFAVSVLLAVVVSFGLRYLAALAAFWLLDDRGVHAAAGIAAMFFSGMVLPLVLFPGWLGTLARILPWAATIQVPADVFLGQHGGWGLAGALGFQALWAGALLALGRLVTAAARRRVVVNGG
ncbi:MAG: ABC transporter permease [Streptomycetales bacterium]